MTLMNTDETNTQTTDYYSDYLNILLLQVTKLSSDSLSTDDSSQYLKSCLFIHNNNKMQ